MALVSSCICCSLLTAAIMSGIISTFMYALIFCLEVWWIIDAKVSLSVPAYILACGYFIMFVVSITMLLGLRTRRTRLLLCWLLVQVLYVFPEAGLVLFMSIYHWNGETFGIVELALWATRVIFNVFGIVSVQSLWSYWKDEKSVFRSLQELGNTNGGVVGGGVGENGLGIPGQLKLRGSLRYQSGGYSSSYPPDQLGFVNRYANQLGYANPAFSGSSAHIRGGLAVTKYGAQDSTQLARSSSSSSGFVAASRYNSRSHSRNQGYGRDNYGPELGFNRSHSQFDLPSFGLDPDSPIFLQPGYGPGGLPLNIYRGNSRRDQLLSERMEWYKPRSLGNLAVDLDTISIWSGQYDNRPDFDGFDRKYRAASMGNLNIGYSGDWRESRGGGEVGSKQSLGQISGVSDNPEKYRDIAL